MKRHSYVLAAAVCLVLVQGARAASANGIFVVNGNDADTPVPLAGVRLTDHRVKASVSDRVADVTVEQTFHSDVARDLEGTWLFPLPSGAAVKTFAMTMGGKMVEGEILEAKQARGIYEGIVRRQRDPGLLEKAGDGLFRARVFPIPARGDVTIRLSYQEVLADEAGTLEFRYPLATGRMGGAPPNRVSVDVSVECPVALKAVYSPSHPVETKRDGERKARVVFESAGRQESRDFLLFLGRGEEDVGFSVVSTKPASEDGTFLLVFAPRATPSEAKRVRKDVVFVLDTSGSMQGEKIRQAKAALAFGVGSLKEGDRFEVLSFATGVRPWKGALVDATPGNVTEATRWIADLDANGGTDIADALTTALSVLRPDRLSFVAFVTDGRPTVGQTDPTAILATLEKANAAKARVFTFGVGYDLDVALLDRIAESTKASRAYVQPGEDLEIATSRFFRKVAEPVLADVSVELSGSVYDVYPSKIPDLFAGEQVTVFGRYRSAGNLSMKVRGRAGDGNVELTWSPTLRADVGPDFLPRLWANRKVAYLLDEIRLHGRSKELVEEVVSLAKRHKIVTPYTSALVVEDGELQGRRDVGAAPTIRDADLADHTETDDDVPFDESYGEGGLSDAPFEGRGNRLIGIGGGAGGAFKGRGGRRDLRTGGGGRKSDDAIEHALRWLAAHQRPDGNWPAGATPEAAPPDDVSATALALLAFLGAGYTNRSEGPYGKVVGDGLRWLKNVQRADGGFGASSRGDALATLALVEAYGMTGSPIYLNPARKGVDSLILARAAWTPPAGSVDPAGCEAFAWTVLALRTARYADEAVERAGKPGTFRIPPEPFEAAAAWLSAAIPPAPVDPTALAARAIVWVALRAGFRAQPEAQAAVEELLRRLPAGTTPEAGPSWSAIALAAPAAFACGGDLWTRWDKAMRTAVIDTQRMDGDYTTTKGLWDARGVAASGTGPVESTALAAMCMEVYDRYDMLTGRALEAASGPAPAAPPSDADRVKESEDLRRRREASSEGDLPPPK